MRHRKSERGQAILEAAVMLPVLVFVALALIDMQWMLKDAGNLDYIVTETARCEAIAAIPCAWPKNPQTYAVDMARNFRLNTDGDLTVETPPCNAATGTCTVKVTYRYHAVGAYFPSVTLTRTGTASLHG